MSRPKGLGKAAGSGRKKGTPNKITVMCKEAFAYAFEGLGGVPALIRWGKTHKTEFYKLYSRLIPVEVHGKVAVTHEDRSVQATNSWLGEALADPAVDAPEEPRTH